MTDQENGAPAEGLGSIVWAFVGALLPPAGLILYLVWRNKKPGAAKSAILGTAVGIGVWLITTLLGIA